MKRLLVHLMIFSILVSGAAWSWDDHEEIIAGHRVTAASYDAVAQDDGAPMPSDEVEQHDHYCCHGNVHLTGVFLSLPVFPNGWTQGMQRFVPHALLGQPHPPLLKPPRA